MPYGREVYVRGERWLFDPDGRHVEPADPKHYEPCWCWSGKKFKSCHMLRDQAKPAPISDVIDRWHSRLPARRCLAPGAPTGCSGKIVDSHVIQRRGGGLETIARCGMVYGFKFHPMFFVKKQGVHTPEPVGIGLAGTAPLFCAPHDRELFRRAETESFSPTARQLLELNFRTVACRLHTNEAVVQQVELLYTGDAGLSRDEQRKYFIACEAYREESNFYLENTRALKRCYDAWMTSATDPGVNALVLRLHGQPDFMCASLTYAIMDFRGNPLPPPEGTTHLCFYTIADGNEVSVVFAWIGPNAGAEKLCRSLLSLPQTTWASAVLQYGVEYIDDIYFRPDWWDELLPESRSALVERLTAHSKPFREHYLDALVPFGAELSSLRSDRVQVIGSWVP